MYYYTKILFRLYNTGLYCNDLKMSQNICKKTESLSVEPDDVL